MTHAEAQAKEMAELYLAGKLPAAEREAFEDHYFGCEECFAEVQALEKMRGAVKSGDFSVAPERNWAMWGALAAALAIGTFSAWQVTVQAPKLESEKLVALARVSELEKELAGREAIRAGALPVLVLEATRDGGGNLIQVGDGAAQMALWMDVPPGGAGLYRLEIRRASGELVAELKDLRRNAQGAVAVTVPLAVQGPGDYRARLFAGAALTAEYAYTVGK